MKKADTEVAMRVAERVAGRGETLEAFLSRISNKAYNALKDLDEKFVGTPDYMGLAYFWAQDYKFSLREALPAQRRAVHKAFLQAKLDPDGVSSEHEAIVEKLVGL